MQQGNTPCSDHAFVFGIKIDMHQDVERSNNVTSIASACPGTVPDFCSLKGIQPEILGEVDSCQQVTQQLRSGLLRTRLAYVSSPSGPCCNMQDSTDTCVASICVKDEWSCKSG